MAQPLRAIPRLTGVEIARLFAKLDRNAPGGCWVWTGRIWRGYGQFTLFRDGRRAVLRVHRVVYRELVGEIPEGMELDHRCKITLCANPAHLEPVTHRVNLLRSDGMSARAARRTTWPRGHLYDWIRKNGQRWCRTCHGEARRRWREQNPEMRRAQQRRYRARKKAKQQDGHGA